jgi:hypothetical protein
MTEKLAFALAAPEHKVINIPMTRERWFELAARQNVLRTAQGHAIWPGWKIEETYAELHP